MLDYNVQVHIRSSHLPIYNVQVHIRSGHHPIYNGTLGNPFGHVRPHKHKPQHTPVVLLISNIDYRAKHRHCLRNIGFNAANFTHDNIP